MDQDYVDMDNQPVTPGMYSTEPIMVATPPFFIVPDGTGGFKGICYYGDVFKVHPGICKYYKRLEGLEGLSFDKLISSDVSEIKDFLTQGLEQIRTTGTVSSLPINRRFIRPKFPDSTPY